VSVPDAPKPAAPHPSFRGPKCWAATGVAGLLLGAILAIAIPAVYPVGAAAPTIPLWLVTPFVLLLASIALMPFISSHFWHDHFPDFAFFLGGIAISYYLIAFSAPGYEGSMSYGLSKMVHTMVEYYSFIALVGGLFVVSGGILVEVRGRGGAMANVVILALGAVLANLVGTTGASMLLIRPYMRINRGRLRPMHIVMFIFIVSNCGGCLTPIGDPPLYLGFLKGVPFYWTIVHLWDDWLLVNGLLLLASYGLDSWHDRRLAREQEVHASRAGVSIRGTTGLVCLVLMIAGVVIDPVLDRVYHIHGVPAGATFQIAVAWIAHRLASREILKANDFTFFPVKEVGLLFLGIFATMTPALGYLSLHGAAMGLTTPSAFYAATGSLSGVLDNAPTYLAFLQIAMGPVEISRETVAAFISTPLGRGELHAISTAAVFFGAMTYIGNGPNFMVKSIAEAAGVKMPSFFGYIGRALVILLPILVLNWLLFIR
jgi:Na+/H+ antiporter NhaD/arsenite permease-like protein